MGAEHKNRLVMTYFGGIKCKDSSGAPVMRGMRLPTDAIVDNFEYGMSVGEIAEQLEIPPKHIEAIVACARDRGVCY